MNIIYIKMQIKVLLHDEMNEIYGVLWNERLHAAR